MHLLLTILHLLYLATGMCMVKPSTGQISACPSPEATTAREQITSKAATACTAALKGEYRAAKSDRKACQASLAAACRLSCALASSCMASVTSGGWYLQCMQSQIGRWHAPQVGVSEFSACMLIASQQVMQYVLSSSLQAFLCPGKILLCL